MKLDATQAAAAKLSHLIEPGRTVYSTDGLAYRVLSKIAARGSLSFRLANLQGQPVPTPANFSPISGAWMRFASLLKYAYNKDLTAIVNEMITQAGLPTDPKMDWAKYLTKIYSSILNSVTPDQDIQDEVIYRAVVSLLFERTQKNGKKLLENFAEKVKGFDKETRKKPIAEQVSSYLKSTFIYYAKDHAKQDALALMRPEEMSMEQPGEEGETYNILDTEEHATVPGVGQGEADRDIDQFIEKFQEWVKTKETPKSAPNYAALLKIYWDQSQQTESGEVKISDLTQEWIRRTGLSFDSLKQYRDKLGGLLRDFVYENGKQLGNSYRLAELLQHMFPPPPKAKARPAKASFKAAGCIPSEYCPQCGNDENGCHCPNKADLLDGETRGDKTASDHHRKQVCKCGSVQTCRCSAPKVAFNVNSCSNCRTAAEKPKCPHCGSDDYGLMPTDFETAKCNDCGKNWEHGIVKGINDPKEAAYGHADRPINEEQQKLEEAVSRTSKELKKFPKGPTGMTPDATKATPEWQAAKRNYDQAFQALRNYNSKHTAADLGRCSCEWEECPLGHKAGGCPNPAAHMLEIYGYKTRYCQPCTDATIEYIRLEQGTGDADNTVKILSALETENGVHPSQPEDQKTAAPQTDADIHPPAGAPYCDGCDRLKANCICDGCECPENKNASKYGDKIKKMEARRGESIESTLKKADAEQSSAVERPAEKPTTLQKLPSDGGFKPIAAGPQYTAPGLRVVLAEDWFIYVTDETTEHMWVYNTEMWYEWGEIPNAFGEDTTKPQPTVEAMIPYAKGHTPKPVMKDNGQQLTLQEFQTEGAEWTDPEFEKEGMIGHDFVNADQDAIRRDITPGDTGRGPHEADTTELQERRVMGAGEGGVRLVVMNGGYPMEVHKENCRDMNMPKYRHAPKDWVLTGNTVDEAVEVAAKELNSQFDEPYDTEDLFRVMPCCRKKTAAELSGRGGGSDDVRGAGDLWREEFYQGGGSAGAPPKIATSPKVKPCCGSVTPYHRPDCKEYNENFDKTLGTLYPASAKTAADQWKVTIRDPKGKEREEKVRGQDYSSAERAVTKKMKDKEQLVSMTVANKTAAPAAAAPAAPAARPAAPQTVVAPPAGTAVALPGQQPTTEDDKPMRKTVVPELPGKKWHMTSKTASILEDAFEYFMEGKKEGGLADVFNERYTRTGKGEDKYIACSKLMMDFEYAFRREEDGSLSDIDDYREDAENALREIVGDDPNYSEKPDKTSAKETLLTEQNTPEMEARVAQLAQTHPETEIHENCNPYFEHGQWWIVCGPCGATWSVVDVGHHLGDEGDLDLEQIDHGDDSCQENFHESALDPKAVALSMTGANPSKETLQDAASKAGLTPHKYEGLGNAKCNKENCGNSMNHPIHTKEGAVDGPAKSDKQFRDAVREKKAWIDEGDAEEEASEIQDRLEYLRGELRAERISQGELMELQGLADYIDPGDVELLEAAGVEEFIEHEKTYNPSDEEKKMLKDMGIKAHKTEASVEKEAFEPGANSGIRGSNDGTYIYQADVWCENCAKEIAATLDADGQTPANVMDEASYDSDHYPKGPFFEEESDAPEHCAGCHIFLENPLTADGVEYMTQMVDKAVAEGRTDEPHIKEWMDFYDYHPQEQNMEEQHESSDASDKINAMPQRGRPKTPAQLGLNEKSDLDLANEGLLPRLKGSEKEAAGQNFNISGLTPDQVTVACACLNMSPEQGKPEANAQNLSFFQTPFVYEALEEALAGNKLTPAGVEVANSILSKKEACMASKEAAASQPTSGEDEGLNVKVIYNKYGITLEPTPALLSDVQGVGETIPKPSIWELMEDFFTNGWEMVNPEDIGALTDGEIMADQDGNVYWHERYQIEDMVEMLMNGEKVNLQYGGNLFEMDEGSEIAPPAEHQSSVEKEATGEMSQAELDANGREEWPMHYNIADALGAEVKPFDQYQGPYVRVPEGRLWVTTPEGAGDGAELIVWNEGNRKSSEPFMWDDENAAVDAALSVMDNPPANTLPWGSEREEQLKNGPDTSEVEDVVPAEHPEGWTPTYDKGDKERLHGLGVKGSKKQAAPGDGGLSRDQQKYDKALVDAYETHPLIEMLWNSLKHDPQHKDRVQTAWGTKTKQGLVLSVARIMKENPVSGE
jgi:hypothetical protein